jgi:hypothetical protein
VPERESTNIKYNIIEPQTSIYKIIKSNVVFEETTGKYFEKRIFQNNDLVKIERYDDQENLTDGLNIPAVTVLEYNKNHKVRFVKYFNRFNKKAVDPKLNYWSKEIIYSNANTLIEIFSDTTGSLLKLPKDKNEQINYIAPVIVYLNTAKGPLIKAFDSEFNLISEQFGEKPCIPFIDCGGNE